ncbi:MAG: OmpA family protein [Rhodopila sp.]|nr:OmpA family protein [Rhodopila sp.]
MRLRNALLATTMLMFPLAVEAQTSPPPVLGIYLGAAGGFNIKTNININNFESSQPGAAGLTTPNASLSTGIGGAAVGTLGYGLGNGLRVEVEFNYRGNSFSATSGNNRSGFGASTSASGSEKLYGPMVNVDYDFNGLVPWMVPYVGLGVGYQRAHLNDFSSTGTGTAAALAPTFTSQDTRASFAAQGILGAAFNIPSVPGLALTAEYRIMALTGTRTYDAGLTVTTPTGPTTRFGKFELGHDLNNTFLFGVRYNFGAAAPPPPPAPAPIAAPAPAPSRSYLVFFDWDKASLTDRARQIIKDAADNSTRVQYTRIEVNGYTDTSGKPQYNQGLSVRRAQAVAAELTKDGVPQNAITIQGFGDTHLLVSTGPGVREPQNRRVEIIIR